MSRIGKKPVELPSGVTASVSGQNIEVKGPKGALKLTISNELWSPIIVFPSILSGFITRSLNTSCFNSWE